MPDNRTMRERIARFFGARARMTTREARPMTSEEREQFDRIFVSMDATFAEADKLFKMMRDQ